MSAVVSSEYSLCDVNLEESSCLKLCETRLTRWKFCEESSIPVPESNVIMMTVSSAIYHFLLDCVVHSSSGKARDSNCEEDDDGVYYRFGGGAISDMLHLWYKQIRSCKDDLRDRVSQEIAILQAMLIKDRSQLPDYLKYRDCGYMYFPLPAFLPFLHEIDTTFKKKLWIATGGR